MRIFPQRLCWLGVLIAFSMIGGCAPRRGGTIPYATQPMPAPDAPSSTVASGNNVIAAGDVLTIDVFQAEKLSKDYTVDPLGNLTMPLIGTVPAIGKTIPDLRRDIARRLSQQYMNNPDVSITIKESTNRLVTVEGSVKQAGMFSVTGPLTLVQAIAMARGTDDGANPRRVGIFRMVDGKRMAAAFDLTSIRRGEDPDPQIYAGDIIVVDGSSRSTFMTVLQSLPVLALFRPY